MAATKAINRSLREAILRAGISHQMPLESGAHRGNVPLPERVDRLLKLIEKPMQTIQGELLCLAMYDIEDNKVRTLLAKYLLRIGFIRIQKSVYVGRILRKNLRKLQDDLAEVNELYENRDSIILMPLHGESLADGKLIGKEVNLTILLSKPRVVII